ncbi:MAG TPA: hypothetical protein VFZ25_18845, partial [Chloroflexota bacterium]|nr:hypothetical protein [Chloroflexota bacterium]
LVVDFDGAKDSAHPPDWLKDDDAPPDTQNKFKEFQGAQYVSIGALMEVVWAYALTFGKADKLHFEDWNKLLNPFTANILDAIGKHENEDLDPNQPLSKSPGLAFLQLLATATDLRSWVPFIGWILLWLPDGARSFLEQGASRASGDLYSTILSADDEFNRESDTRSFLPDIVPDYHSANIEKPLGEVTRLMVFPEGRSDRLFKQALANAPGSPITYVKAYTNSLEIDELVSIGPQSDALFHPDLYEPLPPAVPGAAKVKLDGPKSSPAAVAFLKAAPHDRYRPRLRAFTPLPAQVVRTAGFYFMPASPAKYDCIAYYQAGATQPNGQPNPGANAGQDAKTQEVTLTIVEGDVTFGGDKVPYVTPLAAPAVPAALATPLKRFVTETLDLSFGKQFVGPDPDDKNPGAPRWELNLCTTAAASPPPALAANTVTATAQTHGWKLEIGKIPGDVRVRVFRIYRKNDNLDDAKNDHAFDLMYPSDKYPSLKNVRSYLDNDVWILARDFQFKIEDLPDLTTAGKSVSIDTETVQKLDLALALPGDVKPKVTVNWDRTKPRPVPDGDIPIPGVEKTKDTSAYPHGEVWNLKSLGSVLEEDSAYKVTVTFGKGPANTVDRTLDVAVKPFIRLKGTGAAPFEAVLNKPCTLTVEGGSAPYKVSDDGLPADTKAVVNGSDVVVTVAKAPTADKKVVLTVTDANGKKGRRTITVKKA